MDGFPFDVVAFDLDGKLANTAPDLAALVNHTLVGADTVGTRKPDPLPLREAIARAGDGCGVLVGDSITDADTASEAAVPFVAVSFGFSDRPVEALGADAVIDRHNALLDVLERL